MNVEGSITKQIVYIISQVGFPIVVCFFLLIRYEKKLDKMTTTLQDMCNKGNIVLEKLNGGEII